MMKRKWQIIGCLMKENELVLQLPSDVNLEGISACGQMLVDSDSVAFIYLLEQENEYVYLEIPQSIWLDCKRALEVNATFVLSNSNNSIELVQFDEEMEYLIDNIQGNGNYGEKMGKEVEAIFL